MSPALSLYLDMVRIAAALFVVYAHSNLRFLLPEVLPLAEFGHSAVVVFFVLSGYVIAFASDSRERDAIDYAAARLSRIAPLALFSVLAALTADSLGRWLAPELYQAIPADRLLLRLLLSAGLLNELWWLSVMPFSNVPQWSLCYEAVYYLLFGIAVHARAGWRGPALAAVAIIAGPKILLLAPCWLAGVAAWRFRGEDRWRPTGAALAWLGTAALFWLYHRLNLMRAFAQDALAPLAGPWLMTHLALVVAVNFVAARSLLARARAPAAAVRAVAARLGMLTFAIYILHFPLLYLGGALALGVPAGGPKWAAVVALTLGLAMLIGTLVDRARPGLRAWLLALGHRVRLGRNGTAGSRIA
jgi:peptidoglycan/LPS O-acetylase OafA/YrhL